jgi:hypothetical protein
MLRLFDDLFYRDFCGAKVRRFLKTPRLILCAGKLHFIGHFSRESVRTADHESCFAALIR